MKWLLIVTFSLGILSSCTSPAPPLWEQDFLDLSHPFDKDTIYWPTEEGFILETEFQGFTEAGFFYTAKKFRAAEHGGTHMDAPIHFFKDRATVGEIPLTHTIGPAVVIDVSKRALKNPDYQIFVEDLLEWERHHNQIPPGSIVLLKTGYGKYYPDRKKYLGTEKKGAGAVAKLHFPGLHPGAARWLVQNRAIKAVGIDTASIDFGQSKSFHTHQIMAENNVPIFENVANLGLMPAQGATLIALPMKIREGSGAPIRILAVLPESK